ncbi:hypothetical protein M422DRAFT_39306 [Sphaerobolus stellatus SS14]|uniref:protein-tyrosine-phosphatase n=1 Tax=Sphaerobolus stellatus (strain SS14) TaxID=990650 RepID=A0A0C9UF25_SPHS4|nr:hypothetical protein M422DRAFT_39306 [Sphaerobolus stellatus SS14]
MPSPIQVEKSQQEKAISKLSRALSKLNLRSPGGTSHPEANTFRQEQAKLLQSTHSNAKSVLSRTPIPSGLSQDQIRDYIYSISITPKGTAFVPRATEVIPETIFISDRYTGTDEASLTRLGITEVVAIVDKDGLDYYRSPFIHYHEIVEPQRGRCLVGLIDKAVDFIDEAVREGGRVLIFCRMGVEWSAAVSIAWLIRHRRCTFDHAYWSVWRRREVISPTKDLEMGVKEWQGLEYARSFFPVGRGGRRTPTYFSDSDITPPSSPEPGSVYEKPLYGDDGDVYVIDIK